MLALIAPTKIPMRPVTDWHPTTSELRLTLSCKHTVSIPRTDATVMRLQFRLVRGEGELVLPCAVCYAAELAT
jgi:hypothetical protein